VAGPDAAAAADCKLAGALICPGETPAEVAGSGVPAGPDGDAEVAGPGVPAVDDCPAGVVVAGSCLPNNPDGAIANEAPPAPFVNPCENNPTACIEPPQASDLGAFGASDINELDPTAVFGFTGDHVKNLPPASFGQLSADQLGNLPPDAVDQISSEQLGSLAPSALGSFSGEQIGKLNPTSVGALGAEQLGNVQADAFAGFGSDQVDSMLPAAFAGLKPEQVGKLNAAAVSSLDADQMSGMSNDAMAGFGSDQVDNMPPAAFTGLKPEQVGKLNAAAVGSLDADQMSGMSNDSFAGFDSTQVVNIAPAALGSLKAEQLGQFSEEAVSALDANQIRNVPPAAFITMSPSQIDDLDPQAMGGLSSQHFAALPPSAVGALNGKQLGALDDEVLGGLSSTDLLELNPEQFQEMEGDDFSHVLTNLDSDAIKPDEVVGLLPPGWTINTDTLGLTAPPGDKLAFRALDQAPVEGTKLPKLPDLNSNLSLGGNGTGESVLTGMDNALQTSQPSLKFSQSPSGVLTVGGDAGGTPLAAFVPDVDNIRQAPAGFIPGLAFSADGIPVLTTADGKEVPLKGTLAQPEAVANLNPGTTVDVAPNGDVILALPKNGEGNGFKGGDTIAGTPSAFIEASSLEPGIYRETTSSGGEQVRIVNTDGTAQLINPTVNSIDEFQATAEAFGVTMKRNLNGEISILSGDDTFKIDPSFDVTQVSEVSNAKKTPTLAFEGSELVFMNSSGQEQRMLINQVVDDTSGTDGSAASAAAPEVPTTDEVPTTPSVGT
jgi:outer membrane lipoprotein SlyB